MVISSSGNILIYGIVFSKETMNEIEHIVRRGVDREIEPGIELGEVPALEPSVEPIQQNPSLP